MSTNPKSKKHRPFPNTPLAADGRIRQQVIAARERGIFFDIGHGMGSFSFEVGRTMLDQGFMPDTISSDIHVLCINGPVYDQLTTLSKFLCLGMTLEEVIGASSENAAKILARPELGSLKPGCIGDAVILSVDKGDFVYTDAEGESLNGGLKLNFNSVVTGGKWWHPI